MRNHNLSGQFSFRKLSLQLASCWFLKAVLVLMMCIFTFTCNKETKSAAASIYYIALLTIYAFLKNFRVHSNGKNWSQVSISSISKLVFGDFLQQLAVISSRAVWLPEIVSFVDIFYEPCAIFAIVNKFVNSSGKFHPWADYAQNVWRLTGLIKGILSSISPVTSKTNNAINFKGWWAETNNFATRWRQLDEIHFAISFIR